MSEYTLEEVAQHCTDDDLWVIIDNGVYDLSDFADAHPGGLVPLRWAAGKDVTADFYGLHRGVTLDRFSQLKIGTVAGAVTSNIPVAITPYSDPRYWRKHSPYYNESHHRLRAAIRTFLEREVMPTAAADDENGVWPTQELSEKMGEAGMLAAVFGSAKEMLLGLGITTLPGGVSVEEFDLFHGVVVAEEFKGLGCYGLSDGLVGGLAIGLPPVLKFGSPGLRQRIGPPVIQGKKRICLCISEPYAGSDVAQLRTNAVKTPCGKFWILNGVKKWITGGMFSDFFTVLAQTTNSSGKAGMTMMVVERDDTVSTKKINTSYSQAAGTAYVEFDNTRVPVENQVGDEGVGFLYCVSNFNEERWGMVVAGNHMSRLMVKECFQWATQRKIFGKRLIDQPVIRFKLAQMVAEVEAVHSMMEDLTFQMMNMTPKEIGKNLAGPIALCKYKQTRTATLVADNACQIFGGRALTRSGMGVFVEKFQRSYKMQAILGGSEEVMADFAIRQAMKLKRPLARL